MHSRRYRNRKSTPRIVVNSPHRRYLESAYCNMQSFVLEKFRRQRPASAKAGSLFSITSISTNSKPNNRKCFSNYVGDLCRSDFYQKIEKSVSLPCPCKQMCFKVFSCYKLYMFYETLDDKIRQLKFHYCNIPCSLTNILSFFVSCRVVGGTDEALVLKVEKVSIKIN